MGRIRTVKPDAFVHEELFDSEAETGLPLRLAYIGLWTQCDREGRFLWRPRQLKTDILPYDDVDFSRVLHALWTRGFLVKYASDGRTYGCIPSWSRHQVINNRERDSDLPAPNEATVITEQSDASATRASRDKDACPTRLSYSPSLSLSTDSQSLQKEVVSGQKQMPLSILKTVLDDEHAEAVVDHRKRLRAPLGNRAAKQLAAAFAEWPDPNAAADEMLARGWRGFKAEWMTGRNGTGPPRQSRTNEAADRRIEKLEREKNAGHSRPGLRLEGGEDAPRQLPKPTT